MNLGVKVGEETVEMVVVERDETVGTRVGMEAGEEVAGQADGGVALLPTAGTALDAGLAVQATRNALAANKVSPSNRPLTFMTFSMAEAYMGMFLLVFQAAALLQ
jgi:hypothetical protein